MQRTLLRIVLAAGIVTALGYAQERWDDVNFRTASISGIHLYGLSVFGGYTTLTGPATSLGQLTSLSPGDLGGAGTYGAEWTLGWRRARDNDSISLRYSGSYNGQTSYSNLNAFGHSLALSASRTIHTKWRLNLSGNAQYTTLAQYLYQPSAIANVAQTPATFDDLAAVYAIGSFSDMQAASMLTETPIEATASRGLLLGDRILTYGVQASASYQASSRLSLTFSSFGAGGQSTLDGNQAFTMPATIGGNAGAALSYNLSPRTSLGLTLTETRAVNQYQSSYGTNAAATLGRKMGPHWFLDLGAGVAYIDITQQLSGAGPTKEITANAALGYRTYSNTFLASYNRGTYDAYGLAAGVNTTASGAWTWHRPGSNWMLIAGFGRQQLQNTGFTAVSGWQANGGVSRVLAFQIAVRAEYIYFDSTGWFLNSSLNRAVQTARLSLAWSPQEVAR